MKLVEKTDETLYEHSLEVDDPKAFSTKRLVDRMIKTMQKEFGIGLAAPQVGINLRVFVMYMDKKPIGCINPKILETSYEIEDEYEGCLSFPELRIKVPRPKSVFVEFYSPKGVLTERKLDGIEARCFQHEYDHLDGITMMRRHEMELGKD